MSFRESVRKVGAATILVGGLAIAGPAAAQTPTYVGVTPPAVGTVDSTTGTRGAVLSTQGQITPQVASTQASRGGLALTGADIGGLVLIGGISIGVGVVAVRASRRRNSESDTAGSIAAG
jgi:hypothetical protein